MLFGAGSGKDKGGEGKSEAGETAGEVELGKAVVTAGLGGGDGCVFVLLILWVQRCRLPVICKSSVGATSRCALGVAVFFVEF